MKDTRGIPDQVWPLLENIRWNIPHWPSTFNKCLCGGDWARGAGSCIECTTNAIEALGVDRSLVKKYTEACKAEVNAWREIMDSVREKEDD